MGTDFMRLGGGAILIASLLLAGVRDMGYPAPRPQAWTLAVGITTGVVLVAALQLVAAMAVERRGPRPVGEGRLGISVRITSRLGLALAMALAATALVLALLRP